MPQGHKHQYSRYCSPVGGALLLWEQSLYYKRTTVKLLFLAGFYMIISLKQTFILLWNKNDRDLTEVQSSGRKDQMLCIVHTMKIWLFVVYCRRVHHAKQGQFRNEERDGNTRPRKSCSRSSWDHTLKIQHFSCNNHWPSEHVFLPTFYFFSSSWRWLTILTTHSAHNDVTDVCRLAENIVRCHVVNHSQMS